MRADKHGGRGGEGAGGRRAGRSGAEGREGFWCRDPRHPGGRIRRGGLEPRLGDAHREARVRTSGVEVRLEHLEPAVVQGDEDRIKELLLILVDNAMRYTPEGGRVTLWLKREPPWVTIGVEDTGIGIEPADLPHIFERFYRADKARSRDEGGAGLGLSIAHWIAEAHPGDIRVESTLGRGSTFSVRLPLADS